MAKSKNLTDEEKRIFLSALHREWKICEKIDREKTSDEVIPLVPIVDEIVRKVISSPLWKGDKDGER